MHRHRVNFVCVIDHEGLKVVLFRQSRDFGLGGGLGLAIRELRLIGEPNCDHWYDFEVYSCS